MELHFCSQCGISIPLVEVQSGAAAAGDGRVLCSEHRTPAHPGGRGPASPAPRPAAGAADVELLFCANCRVSVPQGDVASGRARKEFGSMLCAQCAQADPGERSARRSAVESEMAHDAASADPVALRHCARCGTSVPQGHIVTGRARVDGDKVVCERCRDAVPAVTAGTSGATVALVGLVVVAFGAAGFFGAEYLKARPKAEANVDTIERIEFLRMDLEKRISDLEQERDADAAAARAEQDAAVDRLREQASADLVALRTDLAEIRAELIAWDGDAAQRIAKLEGMVTGLQEMVRGLAARPSGSPEPRPPEGPKPIETVDPPPGPDDGGGAPPPDAPVVQQPDPAVTKLLKEFLESADDGTRFNAGLELIRLRAVSAIPAFARAVLQDNNVMVRRVAARGLGSMKAWNGVPLLIQALEDRESYVAQQANFALQAITQQDFGVNLDQSPRERKTKAAAAARWWEKNRASPPEGVSLEAVGP